MADKWMDERDREDRDWRRTDQFGRGAGYGGRTPEDRSFGERGYPSRDHAQRPRPTASRGWQDRDYGGLSPAMRQGGYGAKPRFGSQDYTGGGRFYGDDDREAIYREEYGLGGVEYGDTPRGHDAGYSPTRAAYHARGHGEPGYGGYGSGGYAGRSENRGETRGERFEEAGRGAGEFLHRAGEKVAAWFVGGGEGRAYEPDFDRAIRGHRGKGPTGYKRADERISDDAHERLTDDAWLDATNIAVSVSGGEVTLSGTVETREAKHRAERIVEHISGVNHVQNNLRLDRGNFLTRPASGFGDSVAEAEMRRDEPPAVNGGQPTPARKN